METSIVLFILLWTILIIKALQFSLNNKNNHPNNKIRKDKQC